MTIRKTLTQDWFGDPIDPTKDYLVTLTQITSERPPYEVVSGEELLAAADLFDQMVAQKEAQSDQADTD